jgi:hypothetical protein
MTSTAGASITYEYLSSGNSLDCYAKATPRGVWRPSTPSAATPLRVVIRLLPPAPALAWMGAPDAALRFPLWMAPFLHSSRRQHTRLRGHAGPVYAPYPGAALLMTGNGELRAWLPGSRAQNL